MPRGDTMNEILLGMKIRLGFAITDAIITVVSLAVGVIAYGVWFLYLLWRNKKNKS